MTSNEDQIKMLLDLYETSKNQALELIVTYNKEIESSYNFNELHQLIGRINSEVENLTRWRNQLKALGVPLIFNDSSEHFVATK